jgi:septum formation inhibitor MinC
MTTDMSASAITAVPALEVTPIQQEVNTDPDWEAAYQYLLSAFKNIGQAGAVDDSTEEKLNAIQDIANSITALSLLGVPVLRKFLGDHGLDDWKAKIAKDLSKSHLKPRPPRAKKESAKKEPTQKKRARAKEEASAVVEPTVQSGSESDPCMEEDDEQDTQLVEPPAKKRRIGAKKESKA